MRHRPFVRYAVLVGSTTLAVMSSATLAAPAQKSPDVYAPTARVLGRPLNNWMQRWAGWSVTGPADTNPLLAVTNCDGWSQPEPSKAFYLSANGPGTVAVTCTVPAGVPVVATIGGYIGWQTPAQAGRIDREIATFNSLVRRPKLSVDGVAVAAANYLTTTGRFAARIEAGEFGDTGDVTMRAKGWVVLLRPMTVGTHRVVISNEVAVVDDEGNVVLEDGAPKWVVSSVRYTLNVVRGPLPARPAAEQTSATTAAPVTTTPVTTTPVTTTPAAPAVNTLTVRELSGVARRLPKGAYHHQIGSSTIQFTLGVDASNRVANASAVDMDIGEYQAVFVDRIGVEPSPLVTPTSGLGAPVAFPDNYPAYLATATGATVSVDQVTFAGLTGTRYRVGVSAPLQTFLPLTLEVAPGRFNPWELSVGRQLVLYRLARPSGPPLVLLAEGPASADPDVWLRSIITGITP